MQLDFGYWPDHMGRRWRVSWDAASKVLYWDRPVCRAVPRTALAFFPDAASVRAALDGWADANLTEDIGWVWGRVVR